MFRFFRRHRWLLIAAMAITCITFVFWGVNLGTKGGGGGGSNGDYGTIYGHKITPADYYAAQNDFYLFYRTHYGEWPDKNPNLSPQDLKREIYIRLLLNLKTDALGIRIGADIVAQEATDMLRNFGRNGQPVPMEAFVKQFLNPEGLTADDFERYLHDDLAIQQLIQTMGLPGELVTPQEAAAVYQREHQEYSTQVAFFSASNYLSSVTVTPAAVGQFYTNYLAAYRLPDRVQVSYVEFNASNYLAQAQAQWAKTNLEEVVEANYRQLGPDYFPDAKTPEAAKAKIRETIIHQTALGKAGKDANDFANAVFAVEPAKPDNLAAVAKQKGLTVHVTEPFGSAYGPQEFAAPANFTKAAFALTPDEPLAGPVAGPDAYYVIALLKQLPSEIPPLEQIRSRVTEDYRRLAATEVAQREGTNFMAKLAAQTAAGHGFATACVAAGVQPEVLPPFSLGTRDLPELGDRAELNLVKQTAFLTPAGHTSNFVKTSDGGFVLYVQSVQPVSQSSMSADMPQFIVALRRARQSDAFNQWLQVEASRQLAAIPALQQTASGNAPGQPPQ